MKMVRMAPIEITKKQRKWLEDERKNTGNGFAALIRNLIQEKVSEKDAK